MKTKKIPKALQGVLWSVDVNQLDTEEDKIYIINQILAHGTWSALQWLFKTYGQNTVKEIFLKHPIKNYHPLFYNFAKNILLDLDKTKLLEEKYVSTFPRSIR